MTFRLGVPSIRLTVGGKAFTAYIDTGSSFSIISPDAYRTTGGKADDTAITIESATGSYDVAGGVLHDVGIGQCRFADLPVKLVTPDMVSTETSSIFEDDTLILGRDFLDGFDWTFDMKDGLGHADATPAADPSDRTERAFVVPIDLGASRVANCLLDSGFGHPAKLFFHSQSRLGLRLLTSDKKRTQARHSGSRNGNVWEMYFGEGQIGSFTGAGIVANIELDDIPDGAPVYDYCVIGAGFLQDGRWEIRSSERVAVLSGDLPPARYNRGGLRTVAIDERGPFPAIRITGLDADSPIARSGIRTGDVVLKADGQPVSPNAWREISDLFTQPAGTEVVLQVRRGGRILERSIVLEDLQ